LLVVRLARLRRTSRCATSSAKSVADFEAGFGPHIKEIMADVAKYTDLAPSVQISEVVVG
jgi:uncharacterized protein (TIGR02118 family)